MKKILVTGGAGFLGSHLCGRLVQEGNEVICMDNLYSGDMSHISKLLGCDQFKFIKRDVTEPIDMEADQIYNLACPASPVHYQKKPIETMKTNVIGALNMLELARKNGARILQASTSEVYGDPQIHPQPESYRGCVNTTGVRACYDEGKRAAEALFFDYRRVYQVDIRVIRIFNTYGPNMSMDDGRVISNFIVQALKNEDLTIYGDGSQTRSFCYVDDLIEGIWRMMNLPGDCTGPVNLGNPTEFTVKELAEQIIAMTESQSKIVYLPLPQDDPTQRKPVIALANEVLKWEPAILLEEGLRRTIRYFYELLKE